MSTMSDLNRDLASLRRENAHLRSELAEAREVPAVADERLRRITDEIIRTIDFEESGLESLRHGDVVGEAQLLPLGDLVDSLGQVLQALGKLVDRLVCTGGLGFSSGNPCELGVLDRVGLAHNVSSSSVVGTSEATQSPGSTSPDPGDCCGGAS